MTATTWDRLFHAYGPATDTPAHLAALASGDADAAEEALDHLDGAVLHQGTIWTATPVAVARVAALVADPAAASARAGMLQWLGWAMDAARQADLGSDPVPAPDPAAVDAFLRASAAEDEDAWSLPVVDLLMRGAVADVRALAADVVAAGTPLLDDPDPAVRREAVGALGAAAALLGEPGRSPATAELAALVATAADRDEKAARVLAVRDAGGATEPWLDDPDPAVRACAALGASGPVATAVLLDALRDPAACDAWFTQRPPQLDRHLRLVLLAGLLERDLPLADLVPALTAMIAAGGAFTVDSDVAPILRRTFPDVVFTPGVRPDPAPDWTPAQCAVVAALLANDATWGPTNGNAKLARMVVGLPDDRDEVAALLARYSG
ncbi:hypothetical protein [Nocardioides sp. L-11A]|uniref:hypothetical protein n=1 Tax=Nocardioides sp. L-11A TaxID=3043848 RepID=UPI00249CB971|nr:hypothetical protein QJ852_16605 [Nocardioides sp. L-11A]